MRNIVSKKDKNNLFLSLTESKKLNQRDIRCPYCDFKIQSVFEDARGHLSVRCNKCKRILVINLEYFKRIKRCHRYNHTKNVTDK